MRGVANASCGSFLCVYGVTSAYLIVFPLLFDAFLYARARYRVLAALQVPSSDLYYGLVHTVRSRAQLFFPLIVPANLTNPVAAMSLVAVQEEGTRCAARGGEGAKGEDAQGADGAEG